MTNQTSNEELLQLAIRAAKRNETDNARVMLLQIYERDRRHEMAMMWLAKISRNNAERQQWLERILELNPDNESAKSALERLQYKKAARENRTLVVFGGIAVVMIIVVLIIVLIAL